MNKYDICVIGGCGRVGLPLALAFAGKGLYTAIYDIDKPVIKKINAGIMPFKEKGANELLKKSINRYLFAFDTPNVISLSKFIMFTIHTPSNENMDSDYKMFSKLVQKILSYLKDGQILILRSTVSPGTTEKVHFYLKDITKKIIHVSYCPERIAEGAAIKELFSLPQIVSGFNHKTVEAVTLLFKSITKNIIVLKPFEAELAKVFTNTWRYLQFAVANRFYMIAEENNANFYNIYKAMTYEYPRMKGFPGAGFTAGPCLLKDTKKLSAFTKNGFLLGDAAVDINEGLPAFIVKKLKKETSLKNKVIGILGMAYKSESDDPRNSLAYKLKDILEIEAKRVMCTDEYISDPSFFILDDVLNTADIIIIGAPHKKYGSIKTEKMVIDVWDS